MKEAIQRWKRMGGLQQKPVVGTGGSRIQKRQGRSSQAIPRQTIALSCKPKRCFGESFEPETNKFGYQLHFEILTIARQVTFGTRSTITQLYTLVRQAIAGMSHDFCKIVIAYAS
jgi:hypothetical protein